MDHQMAVASGCTERYLLDELQDDERDAFEAHFLGCAMCAEDVKAAAAIVEGVRDRSGISGAGRSSSGGWARLRGLFWPMPLGAAAALVLALGLAAYQGGLVVPQLRREIQAADRFEATPSHFLYASRSERQTMTVRAGSRRIVVRLSATFEPPYHQYHIHLRGASGADLQSSTIPAPMAGEEMQILLPLKHVPPGTYEIVLDGLDPQGRVVAEAIARYPFQLLFAED